MPSVVQSLQRLLVHELIEQGDKVFKEKRFADAAVHTAKRLRSRAFWHRNAMPIIPSLS